MDELNLEKLMKSKKNVKDGRDRDAFLARLLGIFSEEIVRIWCRDKGKEREESDKGSPYFDLGRPTIYESENDIKGKQIDFCFEIEENNEKKIYISEMKCEILYQDYKFLTLSSKSKIDQIAHHKNRKNQENDKKPNAFERFLYVTQNPTKYKDKYIIKVQEEIEPEGGGKKKIVQKVVDVDGGILVWGRVDDEDTKKEIMSKYKFADILSLEDIVNDLKKWKNKEYTSFINKYAGWCEELFKGFEVNS